MKSRGMTKSRKSKPNLLNGGNIVLKTENIYYRDNAGKMVMDCTNLGVTRINELVENESEKQRVHQLILCNNNLRTVPPNIWLFTNLAVLDLTKNNIKCLHVTDTVGFPTEMVRLACLTTLILSECNLSFVPPPVFLLKSLQKLDLSRNPKLKDLVSEIGYLTSLSYLNMSHTSLTSLPLEIGKCALLEEIILWGCHISELPDTLKRLSRLRAIKMDMKRLCGSISESQLKQIKSNCEESSHFPMFIFECDGLENLSLDGASLNSVQSVQMMALKELYLSNNYFHSIPPDFFRLENLEVLDMSYNNIREIGDIEAPVTRLRVFHLQGNVLRSLPSSIEKIPQLEQLNLNFNRITHLNPKISTLENLTALFLRGNNLSSLPMVISRLKSLETLDVSDNNLTSLPDDIYELSNIRHMHHFKGTRRVGLWLIGNNVCHPPRNIWRSGDVLRCFEYMRNRFIEKSAHNHCRKAVVVGMPGTGKSRIVRQMIYQQTWFEEAGNDIVGIFNLLTRNNLRFVFYDVKSNENYKEFVNLWASPKCLILLAFDLDSYSDEQFQQTIGDFITTCFIYCQDSKIVLMGTTTSGEIPPNLSSILLRARDHVSDLRQRRTDGLARYREDSVVPFPQYKEDILGRGDVEIVNLVVTDTAETLHPWREPVVKTLERLDQGGFGRNEKFVSENWAQALVKLKNEGNIFVTVDEAYKLAESENINNIAGWMNYFCESGSVIREGDALIVQPRLFFRVISHFFEGSQTSEELSATWRYLYPTQSFQDDFDLFASRGVMTSRLLKTYIFGSGVESSQNVVQLLESLNLIIPTAPSAFIVPFHAKKLERSRDTIPQPAQTIIAAQPINRCWGLTFREFLAFFLSNNFSVSWTPSSLEAHRDQTTVKVFPEELQVLSHGPTALLEDISATLVRTKQHYG